MESCKVSVLPCTKAFAEGLDCECACFVKVTSVDVVKELGSSGRRFLWFLVSNPTKNERILSTCHCLASDDESFESAALELVTKSMNDENKSQATRMRLEELTLMAYRAR